MYRDRNDKLHDFGPIHAIIVVFACLVSIFGVMPLIKDRIPETVHEISNITFVLHDTKDNVTLPEYDARNYCIIVKDTKDKVTHEVLKDITYTEIDSSKPDVLYVKDKRLRLEINKERFLAAIDNENFTNMEDAQIQFILNYIFRDITH